MLRPIALIALLLSSSASFTSTPGSSVVDGDIDEQIAAIQELFLNREPCTHECRTDHCTNEERHDIVGSVNRTHYSEDIETCSDHIGATCESHDCTVDFGEGNPSIYEVVEELRLLPAQSLLRATEVIPELEWNSQAGVVQVIGCGGTVVANIRPEAGNR
jgi:hypothetical protein